MAARKVKYLAKDNYDPPLSTHRLVARREFSPRLDIRLGATSAEGRQKLEILFFYLPKIFD